MKKGPERQFTFQIKTAKFGEERIYKLDCETDGDRKEWIKWMMHAAVGKNKAVPDIRRYCITIGLIEDGGAEGSKPVPLSIADLSMRDIRNAYRKLALLEHPDRGGNVDTFAAISEAYEGIKSVKQRLEEEETTHDFFTVVLLKKSLVGLRFRDVNPFPLNRATVILVNPGKAADTEGQIKVGDALVSVCGHDVRGLPFDDVMKIFRASSAPPQVQGGPLELHLVMQRIQNAGGDSASEGGIGAARRGSVSRGNVGAENLALYKPGYAESNADGDDTDSGSVGEGKEEAEQRYQRQLRAEQEALRRLDAGEAGHDGLDSVDPRDSGASAVQDEGESFSYGGDEHYGEQRDEIQRTDSNVALDQLRKIERLNAELTYAREVLNASTRNVSNEPTNNLDGSGAGGNGSGRTLREVLENEKSQHGSGPAVRASPRSRKTSSMEDDMPFETAAPPARRAPVSAAPMLPSEVQSAQSPSPPQAVTESFVPTPIRGGGNAKQRRHTVGSMGSSEVEEAQQAQGLGLGLPVVASSMRGGKRQIDELQQRLQMVQAQVEQIGDLQQQRIVQAQMGRIVEQIGVLQQREVEREAEQREVEQREADTGQHQRRGGFADRAVPLPTSQEQQQMLAGGGDGYSAEGAVLAESGMRVALKPVVWNASTGRAALIGNATDAEFQDAVPTPPSLVLPLPAVRELVGTSTVGGAEGAAVTLGRGPRTGVQDSSVSRSCVKIWAEVGLEPDGSNEGNKLRKLRRLLLLPCKAKVGSLLLNGQALPVPSKKSQVPLTATALKVGDVVSIRGGQPISAAMQGVWSLAAAASVATVTAMAGKEDTVGGVQAGLLGGIAGTIGKDTENSGNLMNTNMGVAQVGLRAKNKGSELACHLWYSWQVVISDETVEADEEEALEAARLASIAAALASADDERPLPPAAAGAAAVPPPPPSQVPSGDGFVAKLQQLSVLLDQGVLSKAEFDQAKQRLLSEDSAAADEVGPQWSSTNAQPRSEFGSVGGLESDDIQYRPDGSSSHRDGGGGGVGPPSAPGTSPPPAPVTSPQMAAAIKNWHNGLRGDMSGSGQQQRHRDNSSNKRKDFNSLHTDAATLADHSASSSMAQSTASVPFQVASLETCSSARHKDRNSQFVSVNEAFVGFGGGGARSGVAGRQQITKGGGRGANQWTRAEGTHHAGKKGGQKNGTRRGGGGSLSPSRVSQRHDGHGVGSSVNIDGESERGTFSGSVGDASSTSGIQEMYIKLDTSGKNKGKGKNSSRAERRQQKRQQQQQPLTECGFYQPTTCSSNYEQSRRAHQKRFSNWKHNKTVAGADPKLTHPMPVWDDPPKWQDLDHELNTMKGGTKGTEGGDGGGVGDGPRRQLTAKELIEQLKHSKLGGSGAHHHSQAPQLKKGKAKNAKTAKHDGAQAATGAVTEGEEGEGGEGTERDYDIRLVGLFERADLNNDGEVSKEELITALQRDPMLCKVLGLPSHINDEDGSREMFENLFHDVDVNDDNVWSWDEFATVCSELEQYREAQEEEEREHMLDDGGGGEEEGGDPNLSGQLQALSEQWSEHFSHNGPSAQEWRNRSWLSVRPPPESSRKPHIYGFHTDDNHHKWADGLRAPDSTFSRTGASGNDGNSTFNGAPHAGVVGTSRSTNLSSQIAPHRWSYDKTAVSPSSRISPGKRGNDPGNSVNVAKGVRADRSVNRGSKDGQRGHGGARSGTRSRGAQQHEHTQRQERHQSGTRPRHAKNAADDEYGPARDERDGGDDDDDEGNPADCPAWVKVGLSVATRQHGVGIVKYIGTTSFALGTWLGVETCSAVGMIDGRYPDMTDGGFVPRCKARHGVWLRPTDVVAVVDPLLVRGPQWNTNPKPGHNATHGTINNNTAVIANNSSTNNAQNMNANAGASPVSPDALFGGTLADATSHSFYDCSLGYAGLDGVRDSGGRGAGSAGTEKGASALRSKAGADFGFRTPYAHSKYNSPFKVPGTRLGLKIPLNPTPVTHATPGSGSVPTHAKPAVASNLGKLFAHNPQGAAITGAARSALSATVPAAAIPAPKASTSNRIHQLDVEYDDDDFDDFEEQERLARIEAITNASAVDGAAGGAGRWGRVDFAAGDDTDEEDEEEEKEDDEEEEEEEEEKDEQDEFLDGFDQHGAPGGGTNEMSMWSRATSKSPRCSPAGGEYFSSTFSSDTLGLFFQDEDGKIIVSDAEMVGAAASNGVQVGDQVLRLNGTHISSAQDLAMLVRQLPRPLELAFRRQRTQS
jgi:hypothetical protein